MLKTRVMPCLLLNNGRLVKTVKFNNPDYIGDPINAIKIYNEKEVDELDKEFDKQVREAFEFARNSPFPDENTVTNHLFY